MKCVCVCVAAILFLYSAEPLSAGYSSEGHSGVSVNDSVKKNPLETFHEEVESVLGVFSGRVTDMLKEYLETGNFFTLISLVLMAFLYGIVNSIRPGHGKAVAVAFLMARGRNRVDGFFVGSIIALMQGLVAIMLMIGVSHMTGLTEMAGDVVRAVTRISIILLTFGGVLLSVKSLHLWFRNTGTRRDSYSGRYDRKPAGSLSLAVAAGMIPCPATVQIMLLAISLKRTGVGTAVALAVTLGSVVAFSAICVFIVTGKLKFNNILDYQRPCIADTIEHFVETAAGISVVCIGVMFIMTLV